MRDEQVADLVREVYAQKLRGVDLTDAILARTTERSSAKPRSSRARWARVSSSALVLGALVLGAIGVARREAPSGFGEKAPAPAALRAVEREPEGGGVAIRSVDFGGTQGAIFLVPGGERDTMVVWTFEELKDEG